MVTPIKKETDPALRKRNGEKVEFYTQIDFHFLIKKLLQKVYVQRSAKFSINKQVNNLIK